MKSIMVTLRGSESEDVRYRYHIFTGQHMEVVYLDDGVLQIIKRAEDKKAIEHTMFAPGTWLLVSSTLDA